MAGPGGVDDEDDETEVDEVDIRNHCKRAEVYSLGATVFQRLEWRTEGRKCMSGSSRRGHKNGTRRGKNAEAGMNNYE
jgi:hypothetical protein